YLKPEAIGGDTIQSDGNTLLTGTAEYHEVYFDFTVKQDPDNLFDGELPVMRFTRYTPEEFEEKFDTLEPGEDTLS
ncbi:MAG: hypothetical protein IJ391_07040, partial [Clostridia bacterium]|nr:hypothetical protein [Clostridia bacterium]